jgi:hypothetical protein
MYISSTARRMLTLLAFVVVAGVVYALSDREWHCGATITKHSAGQIRGPGKARHVGPVSIDVTQHGTIVGGERKSKASDAFGSFQLIDLPGKRNYHFDYTGGVTRLRVRSDAQTIYDGPPVARPPGRVTGKLGIDFEWSEDTGSVTVFDRCSIRSHFDWLLAALKS